MDVDGGEQAPNEKLRNLEIVPGTFHARHNALHVMAQITACIAMSEVLAHVRGSATIESLGKLIVDARTTVLFHVLFVVCAHSFPRLLSRPPTFHEAWPGLG